MIKCKKINPESDLTILCGLMIEAANTDGKLAREEIEKISQILINNFKRKLWER